MKEEENILNNNEGANSLLHGLSKQMPNAIPDQYFEQLAHNIMNRIRKTEELDTVAPLLNTIGKQMPYSIPDHYFNNLSFNNDEQMPKGKIVSFQLWKKIMAAAVVIGIIYASFVVFKVHKSTDISAGIKTIKTEDIVKHLDSNSTLYINTDSEDTTIIHEEEPQVELHLASDEEIQEYITNNMDIQYNNDDI